VGGEINFVWTKVDRGVELTSAKTLLIERGLKLAKITVIRDGVLMLAGGTNINKNQSKNG